MVSKKNRGETVNEKRVRKALEIEAEACTACSGYGSYKNGPCGWCP